MNMEKVIRFKTMIGYCYLYPDKIIMARNGNPEEVNLKNEEQRLYFTYKNIYLISTIR